MGAAPQDLRQMTTNSYGRGAVINGPPSPYFADHGIPKTTEPSNTGYCPNGMFPVSNANKLPNYYAHGYNPLYTPVNAMNNYSNGTQNSFLPPPPPYDAYRQTSSPEQQENKSFDGQSYWNVVKNEDKYEQPIKRMRLLPNEDIKTAPE